MDGEVCNVQCPSIGQSKEFEQHLKEADQSKPLMPMLIDYAVSLGMKRELIEKMDNGQFMDLIGFLNNPKKNS